MVAPAMNVEMWENPATQRNLHTLRGDGVFLAGPAAGDQACGEVGMGRMLEPAEIVEEIEAFFQPKLLAGKRVLVTAGPTEEPIDPVRVDHQCQLREDGLRRGARGARGGREGDAGQRPGGAGGARGRGARRRAQRGADVRGGEEGG